jgi:RHS repeat-associated protein
VWESEVGTTIQNDYETVTKRYVPDYMSVANRDIYVTEDGSFTQRYVYDAENVRLSAEFGYADGTARGATNADNEYGENLASDFAVNDISKVWYRVSATFSTLFAQDSDGDVISHMIYDPWGSPLIETYTDANYSGLDNLNNFTGYTWDEVLGVYYAQNRFYDADEHRFTQQDPVKDGGNWYVYVGNNPLIATAPWGLEILVISGGAYGTGSGYDYEW